MEKERIVFWMAILSTCLYSGHWIAKWYDWPEAFLLKWVAVIPFLIGVIFMVLVWREKQNQDHE